MCKIDTLIVSCPYVIAIFSETIPCGDGVKIQISTAGRKAYRKRNGPQENGHQRQPELKKECRSKLVFNDMSPIVFEARWLLVEWEEVNANRSMYSVVSTKALNRPCPDVHTGKLVTILTRGETLRRAKVVMVSDDRRFLEQQLATMEEHCRMNTAATQMAGRSSLPSTLGARKMEFVRNSNKYLGEQLYDNTIDPYKWISAEQSTSASEDEMNSKNIIKTFNKRKKNEPWSYQTATTSSRLCEEVPRMNMPVVKYELDAFRNRESITTLSPQWNTPMGSPLPAPSSPASVMTYDQQSQTDPVYFDDANLRNVIPKVQENVTVVLHVLELLQNKINVFESRIENWQSACDRMNSNIESCDNSETENANEPVNDSPHGTPKSARRSTNKESSNDTSLDSYSAEETNGSDMVPIGSGKTFVPRHILEQVDWNSYTMATRKLLMALFPRRTLATHSLTGKSSPAFQHKPAKLCLDPRKVSDIVMTVTSNCGVKESLVRGAITTKCADENKMYRMRLLKKERRHKKSNNSTGAVNGNQENVPPTGAPENRHSQDSNMKA